MPGVCHAHQSIDRTLSNDGGGRFRGEFSWPVNPQNITVRSNFGGQATRTVTPRQSPSASSIVCGSAMFFMGRADLRQ